MARRDDFAARLLLLAAALGIGAFILIRSPHAPEVPPPEPSAPPQAAGPQAGTPAERPDPARDAYRAVLLLVNGLANERRFADACERLDTFAREHPGTRWADIALRNRDVLARLAVQAEEQERAEAIEQWKADLDLLEAAGRYEEALEELDDVPERLRDAEWASCRERLVRLRDEATAVPEPEDVPAEPPARAELAALASEAESLLRKGDRAAAKATAERLRARLAEEDVPALDEELGPRASAVLTEAALAEIEAVLPGGEATDLSRLTPRDRIRALSARRDALVRFLETLPRLDEVRKGLRRRLNEARRNAMGVIFDKKVYPDEAHGVVGQAKVDEAVRPVQAIWQKPLEAAAEDDPLLRRALAALTSAQELLAKDKASGAKPVATVLAPIEERYSVREIALDEKEKKLLDLNRAIWTFNSTVTTTLNKDERRLLDCLNGYREMLGLRVLEVEEHLVLAARWHSSDMKQKGYLGHIDDAGRAPWDRAHITGYAPTAVGENCAAGIPGPEHVHWALYHSSGHHRNMVLRGWTHIGIGRAGDYWTEDFGAGPTQVR